MLKGVIGSGVIELGANNLPGGGPLTMTLTYDTAVGGLTLYPFFAFTPALATAWWDYGDGSPPSQSALPSHTYATPGVYTVKRYTDAASPVTLIVDQSHNGYIFVNIAPLVNLLGVFFRNQALVQPAVDGILVGLAANGKLNGIVWLDGGTSAGPSATGAAAAVVLASRGWTVAYN